MKQIIMIHGGNTFAKDQDLYNYLQNKTYNPLERQPNRKKRIAEQLQETHQSMIPRMPCSENADYFAWKIWFDKHFPFLNNDDLILTGNSLG
jgi:hypothetical protein